MMFDDDLKAIEKSDQDATPGPWWIHVGGIRGGGHEEIGVLGAVCNCVTGNPGVRASGPDAGFIARSRTDEPRLVRFARALIASSLLEWTASDPRKVDRRHAKYMQSMWDESKGEP